MDDQVFTKYLQNYPEVFADLTDITWDQFIEIGKVVKEKTGMPMLTNVQGEPDLLNMILQSAGISVFDENGKIDLVDNEGLKEAMDVYMTLVKEGILQEQVDWSGYQGSINNGTVVGTINGSWICATIMSTDQAEQEGNWAGSTDFYDSILTDLGAIATYLPAADSEAYNEKSAYFSDDTIYSKIVSYGGKIPTVNKGIYWTEEKEALGIALSKVINGKSDLDAAIAEAQSTVEFNTGE